MQFSQYDFNINIKWQTSSNDEHSKHRHRNRMNACTITNTPHSARWTSSREPESIKLRQHHPAKPQHGPGGAYNTIHPIIYILKPRVPVEATFWWNFALPGSWQKCSLCQPRKKNQNPRRNYIPRKHSKMKCVTAIGRMGERPQKAARHLVPLTPLWLT